MGQADLVLRRRQGIVVDLEDGDVVMIVLKEEEHAEVRPHQNSLESSGLSILTDGNHP